MSEALIITSLGVQLLTLVTLAFALFKMIQVTQEARWSRNEALVAAQQAAMHTAEARDAIAIVAGNVLKIEVATNSMKDALIVSTAKASDAEGEKRGIAIGVAQEISKGER